MDVSHILDNLNDDQRNAVTSEKQHLLVLAGAGSGKTRVLVHKVAWEVEALGKNPSSIMAVTFTNKAANEMRSRIEELLQSPMLDSWVGTFHGLSHKLLKRFNKEAGLSSGFTIIDSDDQLRIVKRISKELNLDVLIVGIEGDHRASIIRDAQRALPDVSVLDWIELASTER